MSLEHSAPEPLVVSQNDLSAIDDVLARLGAKRRGEPVPSTSERNHNFRVATDRGPLFVRLHRRTRSRERIELGLAAMAVAADQGIPVCRPLTDERGMVLFPGGGRFASVYPWVEAKTYERGPVSPGEAKTIGEIHGKLHVALEGFEHPALGPATELVWDVEQSILDLSRVDDLIRYYPAPGEDRLRVQEAIRFQLALLEGGQVRPADDFADLPRQAIHGDVHEGNVLIGADGRVAAVVDWDMVALAPPLYEVVRALDFCGALDNDAALEAYAGAYSNERPFTMPEAERAVGLWANCVLANTWVYRARFIEGDRRVERFLEPKAVRDRQFMDAGFRAELAERMVRGTSRPG